MTKFLKESCELEIRERSHVRGQPRQILQIHMGCKQKLACSNNHSQNFQNENPDYTQCRPESQYLSSGEKIYWERNFENNYIFKSLSPMLFRGPLYKIPRLVVSTYPWRMGLHWWRGGLQRWFLLNISHEKDTIYFRFLVWINYNFQYIVSKTYQTKRIFSRWKFNFNLKEVWCKNESIWNKYLLKITLLLEQKITKCTDKSFFRSWNVVANSIYLEFWIWNVIELEYIKILKLKMN